jgi:hypothetical protein
MGIKTTGKYCNYCQKNVMAQSNKPNHLLHLVLSVVTAGLWLIVWLVLVISSMGTYRCTQCGGKV